jgi:ribosome modulation factor
MPHERESGDTEVNRIGAAGQSTQDLPGEIESGQPAGGPGDLAPRSREHDPEDFAQQDPFGAGIDAQGSGLARDDCPYSEGSEEAAQWLEGYDRRTGGGIADVPYANS